MDRGKYVKTKNSTFHSAQPRERHNKIEELLSEGEKEIIKIHTSVSFENTSCKNVGSQKNFTLVELNKDDIVFSARSKNCK